MPHISYSELKNWHTCPFYHKLVNIDKIRAFVGNEFTAFGNAIHDTCENMLLDESLEASEYFVEQYKEVLQKLAADDYEFDKKLVVDMKRQGLELIPYIKPALDNYFDEYEIFSTEENLFEDADIGDYKYKGYIDLVLKTDDGKYHIIDWKTCSWGWNSRKRADKMIVYQLVFYKHFFAKKHNIDLENIETHFALLKRTAKKDKVEFFKVTSGDKRIKNALNLLEEALYNISNKKHIKNRLACHGQYGPCEFYKTEHCP